MFERESKAFREVVEYSKQVVSLRFVLLKQVGRADVASIGLHREIVGNDLEPVCFHPDLDITPLDDNVCMPSGNERQVALRFVLPGSEWLDRVGICPDHDRPKTYYRGLRRQALRTTREETVLDGASQSAYTI
ncbi:unnamed protein product [Didymodactylos carnosus]|uniref:Uncharacterized protein n=1 Tax=Didymodactylos carnosus TaxID=1234261 RepID=A0A8S2MB97_9BILA|nr:unnamed protein product [Didymodactylos carnosus]CAF3948952.1 unnamed protein product [Didymodactylos carnosus]